jgi:hypothetical protein
MQTDTQQLEQILAESNQIHFLNSPFTSENLTFEDIGSCHQSKAEFEE